MEDHFDVCAPQYVDFITTCSPARIPDFFEQMHDMHEPLEKFTSINTENAQLENETDDIKAQAELDVVKSTPVKVISPKCRNNKEVVEETTYEEVISDAMKKLELCKKPFKTREALNKTVTQEPVVFKTPNMSKIAKSSRSVGCRSVPNKCVPHQQNLPRSTKVNRNICTQNNDTSANMKRPLVNQALFKQDKNESKNNTFKGPNNVVDNSQAKEQNKQENEEYNEKNNEEHVKDAKKCNKIDNNEHNVEVEELKDEPEESTDNKKIKKENDQDDVDATVEDKKDNRQSSNKHTVLTWCNHRPSLQKRRLSGSKKYVSLAEAVSRFQNDTPERFRTRSKANMTMPLNMSKLMQNRLKPTIPISPALISKNRARPVTVLSQEEREKLEIEEMKKYQIKANPIPPNVLRGSRKTIGFVRKSMAVAHKPVTKSNENVSITNSIQPKNPPPHRDKVLPDSKNMVTKVLVTDPAGIIVKREEITFLGVPNNNGITKNVTRIVPFSFEARNKDMQIKKEQRLKCLQEANEAKPEFHARPVPNFSKPPTPPAKQQQQQQQQNKNKKILLPCPFSFDNRDKKVFEKKEQLVKQVLEEDKRARVFRANPAPIFKPVMVRGRSKEHLLTKDKNTKNERAEDQENREPNIDSSKTQSENKEKTKNTIDKQKAPLKAYPLTLNTDKRAKERYEFNEKLRRKEMEEEAKRQEAEKQRLESEKMMQTKLRKLAEVKAKPMPIYKSPMVVKATKPLTDPQSPAFASKLRSKQT
ncbi:targeting protein for Xklp2 homolog [Solenopsis invicta]|uniref:targeting protein for Xklp2 homolog n=1 Tax=Solenopsis invicta TaxID=13686 RepID=UPI0001FE774A|nr:targeting protein for Xklp2 homolog [Solenopsis invicta]